MEKETKLTAKVRSALIAKIAERTQAFADEFYAKKRGPKVNARAVKLAELSKDFGCYTSKVKALVTELTGVELPEVKAESKTVVYKPFVAVVPIIEPDGAHDYELNFPLVNDGFNSRQFLNRGGVYGNNMTTNKTYVRPATLAEIKKLTAAQLEKLLLKVLVV
jgi:hypothetical protein